MADIPEGARLTDGEIEVFMLKLYNNPQLLVRAFELFASIIRADERSQAKPIIESQAMGRVFREIEAELRQYSLVSGKAIAESPRWETLKSKLLRKKK